MSFHRPNPIARIAAAMLGAVATPHLGSSIRDIAAALAARHDGFRMLRRARPWKRSNPVSFVRLSGKGARETARRRGETGLKNPGPRAS